MKTLVKSCLIFVGVFCFGSVQAQTFKTEAEFMDIISGYVVEARSGLEAASNQALLRVPEGQTLGKAKMDFTGERAIYRISMGYFDESDGHSIFRLLVNGNVMKEIKADVRYKWGGVALKNKVEAVMAEDVVLTSGDVIQVESTREGGEEGRVDYVLLEKTGDVVAEQTPDTGTGTDTSDYIITLEAENFNVVSGYQLEANASSSGGAHLRIAPNAAIGSAEFVSNLPSSSYAMQLKYFDEGDGAGLFQVEVNDEVVSFFGADQNTDPTSDWPVSLTSKMLSEGFQINEGDVIRVRSTRGDSEYGRIDSIELIDMNAATGGSTGDTGDTGGSTGGSTGDTGSGNVPDGTNSFNVLGLAEGGSYEGSVVVEVTASEAIASVAFYMAVFSEPRVENYAPFALGGDDGSNVFPLELPEGSHTLGVVVEFEDGSSSTRTISFEVTASTSDTGGSTGDTGGNTGDDGNTGGNTGGSTGGGTDIGQLPRSADGFTDLNPTSESLLVHVSESSGNDGVSCSNATANNPLKSLDQAFQCIRDGKPDWILLRAGDVWVGENFETWDKFSGSNSDPIVVTSYGQGPRPMIIPAVGRDGFNIRPGDGGDRRGLAIVGLHIYAATRDLESDMFVSRDDEANGINIRLGGERDNMRMSGILFEDNLIEHFDTNLRVVDDWSRLECNRNHGQNACKDLGALGNTFPGRVSFTAHRNILRYAHGADSHSIGIYMEGTRDSVITENFIDHSGWHPIKYADRNKRSHSIYSQVFGGPPTVHGNIFTRAAANCAQFRSGADAQDNLCIENPMGFWVGVNDSKVNRNVHMESVPIFEDYLIPGLLEDIAKADAEEAACKAAGGSNSECNRTPNKNQGLRGAGFNSQGPISRLEVFGNIVLFKGGGLDTKPGLELGGSSLSYGNNIVHDWIDGNREDRPEIILNGRNRNDLNGNVVTKEGQSGVYRDASRDIASYARSLGITYTDQGRMDYAREHNHNPDNLAFYEAVASRPAGEWIPSLSSYAVYDYLKEGFTLK